jgi:hypothetical protein
MRQTGWWKAGFQQYRAYKPPGKDRFAYLSIVPMRNRFPTTTIINFHRKINIFPFSILKGHPRTVVNDIVSLPIVFILL